MRGDFIQKQDRRCSEITGESAPVGKDQADQQCLLFSGRTIAGRHTLVGKDRLKIGAMRADQRATGRHVARAVLGQRILIVVRDRFCVGHCKSC